MPRTAIILAGGSAPSEGSLSALKPKLLLPVANRPLGDYLASVLAAAGVNRVLVLLDFWSSHAADRLSTIFRRRALQVECIIIEDGPRGTGGSLKKVESQLQGDAFWVVSGDLFLVTDLREMSAFHLERGSVATVGALRIPEPVWEMERVELDGAHRVKAIHRIHPAQNKRSTLRPSGLYLFEPTVLDLIPESGHFDLKEQLFPRLAECGMAANVWEIRGYCRTASSVSDYFAANRDVLLNRVRTLSVPDDPLPRVAKWRPPDISAEAILLDPVVVGLGSRIADGAMVIGPTAIGEHCEIAANAILDECVVFDGVTVGAGARLDRCILGEGAKVGEGAVLREMIVVEKPVDIEGMLTLPGKHLRLDASGLAAPSGWRARWRTTLLAGKRVFDAVFAAVALIMLAPILGLVAVAIKLDSPGSVMFRQRRCGQQGREFTMYKFRSMVANAEELKRELLSKNDVDGPMFKMIADPRITRVGRFLRATNLDELPQLWNVLRGDMSLVGPRPLSMDEMRYNPRWRDVRLSVRPGITGLWQAHAHDRVSFAEWIRCDLHYVRRMSAWLDLRILLRTALKAFRPEGVARRGERTDNAPSSMGTCAVDPADNGLRRQSGGDGSPAGDLSGDQAVAPRSLRG